MLEYLAQAKVRTLEHAASLVERHMMVLGLGQQEIRDFIIVAEKAYEAEMNDAKC